MSGKRVATNPEVSPKRKQHKPAFPRLTRAQFEHKIMGEWQNKQMKSGRPYRQNGPFKTFVQKPWKIISDGQKALRAKTWGELAKVLDLG